MFAYTAMGMMGGLALAPISRWKPTPLFRPSSLIALARIVETSSGVSAAAAPALPEVAFSTAF
jgi:hypothetical protein